eukprot:5708172-Pleurochrysis_carterae.AAC.2
MKAEIKKVNAENQRLRDQITELKRITEPRARSTFTATASPRPSTSPSPRYLRRRTSRATRCRLTF